MICPFCKSLGNAENWCIEPIGVRVCSRPKGHKGSHVACLRTVDYKNSGRPAPQHAALIKNVENDEIVKLKMRKHEMPFL